MKSQWGVVCFSKNQFVRKDYVKVSFGFSRYQKNLRFFWVPRRIITGVDGSVPLSFDSSWCQIDQWFREGT